MNRDTILLDFIWVTLCFERKICDNNCPLRRAFCVSDLQINQQTVVFIAFETTLSGFQCYSSKRIQKINKYYFLGIIARKHIHSATCVGHSTRFGGRYIVLCQFCLSTFVLNVKLITAF